MSADRKRQPDGGKKTMFVVCMMAAILSIPVVLGDSVADASADPLEGASLLRERRDGYGGGGYGGGGYGYGGGGSYGCSCPYVSCDNKSDGLLAFGVGALLGLLLSMLRTMMMAAAAPAPAAAGRNGEADVNLADFTRNVTWAGESARMNHERRKSSLLEALHLPDNLGDDLVPVVADLFRIYTESGQKPECVRRWVCEATRQSLKVGGLRARLGSLSSIAFGWYTKDLAPVLHNMIPGSKDLDCKYLAPKCDVPFGTH